MTSLGRVGLVTDESDSGMTKAEVQAERLLLS